MEGFIALETRMYVLPSAQNSLAPNLTLPPVFANWKNVLFNAWNFLVALACLSCAILSAYSAIVEIVKAFQNATSASFSCHSPLDVSG
jgi:hypothetical protein